MFWRWTHFPGEQTWWGYFSLWQEEGHSDIVSAERVWKTTNDKTEWNFVAYMRRWKTKLSVFQYVFNFQLKSQQRWRKVQMGLMAGKQIRWHNLYCWEKCRESQELSEAMSEKGDSGRQAFHTAANTASFPFFTKTQTGSITSTFSRKLSHQCWENTDLRSHPCQLWSSYCTSLGLTEKNDMPVFVIMNRCVSSKKQKQNCTCSPEWNVFSV